ncbi:MAG: phospholipid scramblase-related protein [Fibrobacterota bacterium]
MLQLNRILVKERVGLFKLADCYDLFDPDSGRSVGVCQELPPWYTHVLRLVVNKLMLPTVVEVLPEGRTQPLFRIRRGFKLFRSVVQVEDGIGRPLGTLRSKLLSFRLEFAVLDSMGKEIAKVNGDWKGWNFQLVSPKGEVLGTITKKWAGIGKELFTSADNYMIELSEGKQDDTKSRSMLLAAALAIDICFKENA